MIYLNNTTEQQTVFVPRNDGIGSIHKGSYEQGFEDGFQSGETHQQSLLSSVTFTENGDYLRPDGWSAVTVDVQQTSVNCSSLNLCACGCVGLMGFENQLRLY